MTTPIAKTAPGQQDDTQPASGSCQFSRRGFLSVTARTLTVGFFLPAVGRFAETAMAQSPTEATINSWVRIAPDGTAILVFGGAEMGQGSMSGLAQIIAEELKVPWDKVVVEQALATPGVSYTTGGSSAVRGRYTPLRNAGATARELLVAAAMLTTGDTTRAHYLAENGRVFYTGPLELPATNWGYGELAARAATAQASALLPATIPLTPPSEFKLIGAPLPRLDLALKTNGRAQYGIDVWTPDMVFAVIKHCPTIGGTLAATPTKPAAALAVVPCKASDNRGAVVAGTINAVAVVATNTYIAKTLAASLACKWTLPASTTNVDSASLLTTATTLLNTGTALVSEPAAPTPDAATYKAQVLSTINGSPKKVAATFTLPYLAHGTMEPLCCTVRITFSGTVPIFCEVWAPTQAANSVAATAAALTGLTTASIKVYTTFLGGGLGRKIEQDYISQAIQIALVVKRPVKLTWMREEDFGHDQYRPMAVVSAQAGLDASNQITGWAYRTVTQSISAQRGRLAAGAVDNGAVEGAKALPYNRGLYLTEWVPLPSGIPIGYWRSVGYSINTFVTESIIDMLAKAAGMDPFAFRYSILTNDRVRAVLTAVDQLSSWRHTLPAGRAWGVALVEAFQTVVAEVVEISQPLAGSLTVHRVDCAVDCGLAINPDSVAAQMEGSIVHGISATLWGQTTFAKGIAAQTNFNKNRVLKLKEMPAITVQILPSQNPPTGTGEPGVPPIAPALANAYARLKGTRITKLPFFPGALMGGL